MLVPKLRFKREDGRNYPNWVSGTIGDYYVFKNGLNKEKTAFGQGTPIINYTDVFKNRLLTSKIIKGRVTLSDKEIENHNAVYGDVFFTRTSETLDEVGFCGALIEDISSCVFSGFLLRGRPIDLSAVSPYFAGYYFMTNPIRQEIISKSSITTRALTNGRNLSAVNIKLPCLEEQQKIADFLSTVDEVIAQSEAEVKNLEQQKKGVMQKIFSQEVRFKREDGTEFPDWEMKKLDNVGVFIRGLSYSKDNVTSDKNDTLVLRSNNICEDKTLDYVTGLQFVDKKPKSEQALIKNDIVICMANGSNRLVGKAAQYDGNYHNSITVGAFCGIFRCDLPIIQYIFQSPDYTNFLLLNLQGGDGAIANLKGEDILNFSTLFPCLEEQQKIANFLSAYDEAITYAKQELDKWKELKKGLLQQMFV